MTRTRSRYSKYDEPNMSDTTLLVTVEDLINMCMGPAEKNVVNFKMLQTVLHILARQMRLLEQRVEIRATEEEPTRGKRGSDVSSESLSAKEERHAKSPRQKSPKAMAGIKEDQKAERAAQKEREKAEKAEKEREKALKADQKVKEKAERASSKERERAEKAELKQKEKEERALSKEREKAERASSKEREKAEKAELKEKEKAERATLKEKEKSEKEKEKAERSASKEREKAEKEKEKAERSASKEREKAEKEKEKAERSASKEREKAEKEKEKAERSASKEREKAEKEKEKAERSASKEREKAEKEKEKAERSASKEREKAEKEKEKAERSESKEREKAEKEKEKAERSASKEREKVEKEKERAERSASKEREKAEKEKEKAERSASKEREKVEKEKERAVRSASKEREKAEKEKEKAERSASKEREKAEKEKEKAERSASKEREKAEKDKEKAERSASKEREKAEKEKEKAEKADQKEKEKAEKEKAKAEKEQAKTEKEKEKAIKAEQKEKEKAEKEKERAEKEKEKIEKAEQKDKQKAEKDKAKAEKEQAKSEKEKEKEKAKAERESGKAEREREKGTKEVGKKKDEVSSGTSIAIKEVDRKREKILVVEKGPTTRVDSRSSIEVVTQSQFAILEAAVGELKEKAKPLPPLALPDNQKLREDLAKGSASLTDTMQAMQVDARVQAAEMAIGRMSDLLTQLALAGALPEDVAGKVSQVTHDLPVPGARVDAGYERGVKADKSRVATARKSVAIHEKATGTDGDTGYSMKAETTSIASRASQVGRPSMVSRMSVPSMVPGVTQNEMSDALRALKAELMKNMNSLTAKATAVADNALVAAKSVAEKLDIALKLNTRITNLNSLVADYSEQLTGFDAGLATQMQSFREQMMQVQVDLKGGLSLLENVNNNAETAAVKELNERFEGLVLELEQTVHSHQALTDLQSQLGDELHSLVECVEMLREQKADRDEVQDGLRDKADNSRLAGLMTEAAFAAVRQQLERRLEVCHDKFHKQENTWMRAMRDLTGVADGKADLMQLLGARDEAQQKLRELKEQLDKLEMILGEPKAAILTRKLARDAVCGACQLPALMDPQDANSNAPAPLPPLYTTHAPRPAPQGAEDECLKEIAPPPHADAKAHTCLRWVGGSHTLVGASTTREVAAPPAPPLAPPVTKYTAAGTDGRLYKMEQECQPCVECNELAPAAHAPPPSDGGGDQETRAATLHLVMK